jgi:hypothetical protein
MTAKEFKVGNLIKVTEYGLSRPNIIICLVTNINDRGYVTAKFVKGSSKFTDNEAAFHRTSQYAKQSINLGKNSKLVRLFYL